MEVGQTVRVHYTGTLDDGTQFDSSIGREPLEFKVGTGMMIPGFDKAVLAMSGVGDKTTVRIPAAEAYGERNEDKVLHISKENFPGAEKAPIGVQVMISGTDGHSMPAVITDIDDEFVTLDFNHKLAGKALNFEIEIVELID